MPDEQKVIEQRFREQKARLERALINSCDRAKKSAAGSGMTVRRALFGAVRQFLVENHRDIAAAAIGNPELAPEQKHRINDFNSAVYMYMYALCELAIDGSTQWSDPELLVDQYKHRLREAVRGSDVMVAEPSAESGI